MALMPISEAYEKVTGDAGPLARTERVNLFEAAGRVLARDLTALRTQPPFSCSAMDGYAVSGSDHFGDGAIFDVIGESAAGHGFDGKVGTGEAVRIFTGAPMPHGADTVVIQENTEKLDPAQVKIVTAGQRGQNVRPAGGDFTQGMAALRTGRLMDPTAIMLAAAMSHPEIEVVARPKVAILATGDELKLPGEALGSGQIIASNNFGIGALITANGGEIINLGIAGDQMDALDAAIDSAIVQGADVLVTIGGASVGDHDLVHKALVARGLKLDFWKIAMRPGKPLMSGRLENLRVLGLPGNPASSLVCSYLFMEPLISLLAGRKVPNRTKKAILGKDLKANDQRQDYLRAKLETDADGSLVTTPFTNQDSSLISVFAQADCLVVRPPFAGMARVGDPVDVLVLSA